MERGLSGISARHVSAYAASCSAEAISHLIDKMSESLDNFLHDTTGKGLQMLKAAAASRSPETKINIPSFIFFLW